MSARKGGVASDEEFDAFMAKNAGKTVLVVDARNPDFTIEPDDEKFGGDAGTAPISDCGTAKRRTRSTSRSTEPRGLFPPTVWSC